MAQVIVKDLVKIYDNGFKALHEVSFTALDKEFMVLVGPSGCGKTTALRMIAGLEEITSGEIRIGDKIVNNTLPKDRDIAMVFQNYALYPHMSVFENLAFALKLRKEPKAQIRAKVEDAAKLLGIEQMLSRKPGQLSGGQRQRVALGRAIVRNPKVFLFDEPLSNLDAKLRVAMRAEIVKLHHHLENTMIYVTHDQVEAMTMADKIVVMKDGHILQIDSPLNIYNHPANIFVAGFIGSPAINLIPGEFSSLDGKPAFSCQDFTLPLAPKHYELCKCSSPKKAILGIRPEDLYDARFAAMADHPAQVSAICDLVEPLGSEYHVFLKTKNLELTAKFDPKTLPQSGEQLTISLDMNKAKFFDPDTEKTIE